MLGEKVAIEVGIIRRALPLLRSSRCSYPFLFVGEDALQKYTRGMFSPRVLFCIIDELFLPDRGWVRNQDGY
jgi:hypothetical protein